MVWCWNGVLVDKELVVAGFINTNKDGKEFNLHNIYQFMGSMVNAGCGLVRGNFEEYELIEYLDKCRGICLDEGTPWGEWRINKRLLNDKCTEEEKKFFEDGIYGELDEKRLKEMARSFDLFCKLQVDLRTDDKLLDFCGYRWIYYEAKKDSSGL